MDKPASQHAVNLVAAVENAQYALALHDAYEPFADSVKLMAAVREAQQALLAYIASLEPTT